MGCCNSRSLLPEVSGARETHAGARAGRADSVGEALQGDRLHVPQHLRAALVARVQRRRRGRIQRALARDQGAAQAHARVCVRARARAIHRGPALLLPAATGTRHPLPVAGRAPRAAAARRGPARRGSHHQLRARRAREPRPLLPALH